MQFIPDEEKEENVCLCQTTHPSTLSFKCAHQQRPHTLTATDEFLFIIAERNWITNIECRKKRSIRRWQLCFARERNWMFSVNYVVIWIRIWRVNNMQNDRVDRLNLTNAKWTMSEIQQNDVWLKTNRFDQRVRGIGLRHQDTSRQSVWISVEKWRNAIHGWQTK